MEFHLSLKFAHFHFTESPLLLLLTERVLQLGHFCLQQLHFNFNLIFFFLVLMAHLLECFFLFNGGLIL